MPEEILDIVDNNDNLVGVQKPRSVVHSKRKDWHRTTHIWIINDDREILCQKRSLKKDANPGIWQPFFGGHVKAGETYEKAAISELKDEVGISVSAHALKPIYIERYEPEKHFSWISLLRWNGNAQDLKFNDGEVSEVKWIPLEQLKKLMATGTFPGKIDQRILDFIVKD